MYKSGNRGPGRIGSQQSLMKALGALKDTTTVTLAKVNSQYKVLLFLPVQCKDIACTVDRFLCIYHNVSTLHEFSLSWSSNFLSFISTILTLIYKLVGSGYCYCQGHKSRGKASKTKAYSK